MAKKAYTGSMFQQQYFDGYSRKIVLDGNVEKQEYVYEGIYYCLEEGESAWKRGKILTFVSTLAMLVLLIAVMCIPGKMNDCKPYVGCQALLLFSVLGLLVCSFFRLGAKYRMTQFDYRFAVISVKEFALISMVFAAILVIGAPITLISVQEFSAAAWGQVPAYLLMAGGMMRLWKTVKKESYLEEQSNDLPHGTDITNDFRQNDYM